MKLLSFTNAEQAVDNRRRRREKVSAKMEVLAPWSCPHAVIEPLYRTSGRVGRQPNRAYKVLRMYCSQHWYVLAVEALENALHQLPILREFTGIELGCESVPDPTMLLKLMRLLTANDLTHAMYDEINAHFAERSLLICDDTIVDVTIIAALLSKKIKHIVRNPNRHQAKKGAWQKLVLRPDKGTQRGVDADLGAHTVFGALANANDLTQADTKLLSHAMDAFGDAGYQSAHKRINAKPVNRFVTARAGNVGVRQEQSGTPPERRD